ncbi:AMP-binding protein [Glycomyces arizonensis]|uniref:AMP-binding protein n=1 Tax=Glycomyces arizonensis TaxID=256035 RepID=UPI00041EE215|nr:AMP-binding protein [Glycomyces arizonensis]
MNTAGGTPPRLHSPAVSWGANLPDPDAADLAATLLRAAGSGSAAIRFVRDEHTETELGYGDLALAASKILSGARERGAKRSDKVVLGPMADDRDLLAAVWACVLGGMVPLPLGANGPRWDALDGLWRDDDTVWTIAEHRRVSRARHLGTVAELETASPTEEYEPGGWDDLAVLLPVHSSTAPRAVMLSHGNIISRTVAAVHADGLGPDERTFNWMPFDQVGGLVMSHIRDVYLRCEQVHAPTQWILADPLRWIDQMHRRRTTAAWAPNFAFELVGDNATRMCEHQWDLSALRRVMNGGEGMAPEVLRRFTRLLEPHGLASDAMMPGWGRAEAASTVVGWRPRFDERPNGRFIAAGYPHPGVGIRIVNHFDELLPEGEPGFLEVTGEQVGAGYYGDADASRRAFSADRWFRTGELAYLERGRLTVTGRTGDVIVIGGDAHHGHEIERTVETVASVEPAFTVACAVTGSGGDEPGLAVFYVSAEGADSQVTAKEIREAVRRGHGLETVHVVPVAADDIPQTHFPRLRRALMVQRFEAGAFDSTAVRP